MNSAARRFLFFFFSFAALTACEDPKDIGIDLQDENLIGTTFTDDFTIQTGTVLQGDSILSYRASTALVGQYADPVLGITRSVAFAEVALNGTNVKLGENITADSLVLTLDYNFKYADTLKAMQLNVHRVTSAFDERTSYFTNTPFTYDQTPIGTALFQPRIVMQDKDGTPTKTTRLARIKLSSELANDFIAQSGQPTFADQASFLNYFKGIALAVPEDENGSLVGFSLNSASTSLVLYYKEGDTQRNHTFLLGTGSYFSQITSNRTGTGIEELQNKGDFKAASETGGDSYVQAGTQLLTKITFPDLLQLKEAQGNIIINRAELIIPVKAASTGNNLPVPPLLALYETNDANNILRDPDGRFRAVQQDGANPLRTDAPAILGFSRKNGKEYYSLNITSYVQGIMMGIKPNNGLLLGSVAVTTDANGNRIIQPEMHPYRTIITNTDANPVKLLLYYSKLQ